MEAPSFTCSICGDVSHKICIYCTKDTCSNHLCHRCMRCSDCCHCDMPTAEIEEEERLQAEEQHHQQEQSQPDSAPDETIPSLV